VQVAYMLSDYLIVAQKGAEHMPYSSRGSGFGRWGSAQWPT